jgi:hypothetical protein
MDMYGQPDSLFFVIGILCPPDPSWTELQQEPSNRLIFVLRVFYLKTISREYFSYLLISGRSNISNVLAVLVWEFEFEGILQLRMLQRDAEVI